MIKDQMPEFPDSFIGSFAYKEACNAKGMYAYVSWRWVNPFAAWINGRKCLEVMAGAGYLSYALRQKGVDIIATDDMTWHRMRNWTNITEVEQLTANQAIIKHGKAVDIVIMAWPYMDESAYRALRLINYINPHALLVYIGEGPHGCTADLNFFANFKTITDVEFENAAILYQQFDCMRDHMYLGQCRKDLVRVANNE